MTPVPLGAGVFYFIALCIPKEDQMDYLVSRIREYLDKPGCPLCALLREQGKKYLDTLFLGNAQ